MIDARGLSCPQPVVLTQKAVRENPAGAEILVDNACAVENVGRFAKSKGYVVELKENAPGEVLLRLRK
jgi:tRNA 2-thiouridine synthesizing protein A